MDLKIILLYDFYMEKISELLPRDYKMQMQNMLGSKFDSYLNALNEQGVRGLRVNTNKISVEDFVKINSLGIKLQGIDYANDGFVFDIENKIGFSDEHLTGLIYVQEPSSMIPVCASGIEKENRPLKILDLCASPGGKTGQIACRVNNDSLIVSNEIIRSRAEVLLANIERQGFKNVIVLNEEPKDLLLFKGFFDYVFVDAPCSGEGMFRKNPETISEWSVKNIEMCVARQKEILEIARQLVAPYGKLIYSTCTFNESEDEGVVNWMLQDDNWSLEELDENIVKSSLASNLEGNNKERARKFMPQHAAGEGQFVAVFKNGGYAPKTGLYSKKHGKCIVQIGQSENKLVLAFSNDNLLSDFSWRDLYRAGDNIYLAPQAFDGEIRTALESLRFLLVGVKIGSIEKNRFEPNHNLFMACQAQFKHEIELSEDELKKYLHGEEIVKSDINIKGYAVVTRKGFAVGGVKVSNGRLKNLYPRGLRV